MGGGHYGFLFANNGILDFTKLVVQWFVVGIAAAGFVFAFQDNKGKEGKE
jgi:hypothetical protein